MAEQALKPAAELAAKTNRSFPGDSADYRKGTRDLPCSPREIELRRHAERVAERRRAQPAGGEVPQDYAFAAEDGRTVRLSGDVRERDTPSSSTTTCSIPAARATSPEVHDPARCRGWRGAASGAQRAALAVVVAPFTRGAAGCIQARARPLALPAALFIGGEMSFNRDYRSRIRSRVTIRQSMPSA
jgi:hypothetical protein